MGLPWCFLDTMIKTGSQRLQRIDLSKDCSQIILQKRGDDIFSRFSLFSPAPWEQISRFLLHWSILSSVFSLPLCPLFRLRLSPFHDRSQELQAGDHRRLILLPTNGTGTLFTSLRMSPMSNKIIQRGPGEGGKTLKGGTDILSNMIPFLKSGFVRRTL